MNKLEFEAIMPLICTDLIKMFSEKKELSEIEAIKTLYNSKLYTLLEIEENKIWHYSTPMLYSLLETELLTGELRFPDV